MNSRHIEALSAGALDQLYLAVRLAVCQLCLPARWNRALIFLSSARGTMTEHHTG